MAASCPRPATSDGGGESPDIRVFFATDLAGYLEPCGCQSRPLGGMDRAAVVVATGRRSAGGTLGILGGPTFFQSETIEPTRVGQDRLRAQTMARILSRLGVAVVVPGAADLALGKPTLTGLPLGEVSLVAANAHDPALRTDLVREVGDGIEVGVFGVTDLGRAIPTSDPVAAARAAVRRLERAHARVVIGVVGDGRRTATQIAREVRGIDFLIVAGTGTVPPPPPVKVGQTTLLFGGERGMGIGTLDLWVREDDPHFVDAGDQAANAAMARLDRRIADLETRMTEWQRTGAATSDEIAQARRKIEDMRRERAQLSHRAPPEGASSFVARWEELGPERRQDPTVRNLIDDYDQQLVAINRAALAHEQVVPPVPGRPSYVGAAACVDCHEDADRFWRRTQHAKAYATLVRESKELDLNCVGCHVTGYREPGGSTAMHVGELKAVQCEACHGAGSQHVDASGADDPVTVVRATPEQTCLRCHNTEHSDQFNYRTYLTKIVGPGHGQPLRR